MIVKFFLIIGIQASENAFTWFSVTEKNPRRCSLDFVFSIGLGVILNQFF